MEIRKNNDIKFKLTLVDKDGNKISNIKDVKCTLVNHGTLNFHLLHHHLAHSVMCEYDHTYNVLPFNHSVCHHHHGHGDRLIAQHFDQIGKYDLPVMVDNQNSEVDAYFSADVQKHIGEYNLIVELKCWDKNWADKGVHTHTTQLNNVCKLVDGENNGNDTTCVIPLTVMFQHEAEHDDPTPEPTKWEVVANSSDEVMGTVTGGGIYDHGSIATLQAAANEGYKFVKWSNGTTANPYKFTVRENVTITANFEAKTYKITYIVDGEIWKVDTVKYNTVIVRKVGPEKEGYDFANWEGLPHKMPANDITVVAVYTKREDPPVPETKYVYYGASVHSNVADLDIQNMLKKAVTTSIAGNYQTAVTAGDYVWICVPSQYSIASIKQGMFDYICESPVEKSGYKCYRSYESEGITRTITLTVN